MHKLNHRIVFGYALAAAIVPNSVSAAPHEGVEPASSQAAPSGAGSNIQSIYDLFQSARSVRTALKTAVPADAAPAVVSVLTRRHFQIRGYRTVAEALADIAGLFVTDELVTSTVHVRGISGGVASWSRLVKVLVDGYPISHEGLGGTLMGISTIPIAAVEGIEVIRGPASALYGANAFLGVVNILTTPAPEHATVSEIKCEGGAIRDRGAGSVTAIARVHSGPTSKTGSQDSTEQSAQIAVSFAHDDRSGLAASGPGIEVGKLEGQTSEDISKPISAMMETKLTHGAWGSLRLFGLYQRVDADQEFGPDSFLSNKSRRAMSNLILNVSHTVSMFGGAVSLDSHLQGSWAEDLPNQRFKLEREGTQVLRRERSTKMLRGGIEASAKYSVFRTLVGFDYSAGEHRGDKIWTQPLIQTSQVQRTLKNRGTRLDYANRGYYAQLTATPARRLIITTGVRFDDADKWSQSTSWRLGATWGPLRNLSIKALYGSSFVPPAPVQLTAAPIRFTDSVVGNLSLQPQSAKTYEVGVSYRPRPDLSLQLVGFYTHVDDRVEYVQTGADVVARNLTRSDTVGLELGLEFAHDPVYAELTVSQNHSWLENPEPILIPTWYRAVYEHEDTIDGSLPAYPKIIGNLNVGMDAWGGKIRTNVGIRYVPRHNTSTHNAIVSRGTYVLPSYLLVGSNVRIRLLETVHNNATHDSLFVEFGVHNLLDKSYLVPGSQGVDIPSIGRRIFARVGSEI